MPSKSKKPSAAYGVRPISSISPTKPAPSNSNTQDSEAKSISVNHVNGYQNSSQPEPDSRTGDTTESAGEPAPATSVNRKKQKRREKEAAKRLAEQQLSNGHSIGSSQPVEQIPAVRQGRGPVKGYFTEEPDYVDDGFHDSLVEPEDAFYSGDEDGNYGHDYIEDPNNSWLNTSKRKKSSRSRHSHAQPSHHPSSRTSSGMVRSALPALSNAAIRSAHKMSNEHIWNTSTQAERENIKQFWLELGEEERRSLVKVEKEAVLRKMKEQQKHSCSCSVCGRKRTAIEEELEVLYDAYYEELEQFANRDGDLPGSPRVTPSQTSYRPLQGRARSMAGSYPVSGRIHEIGEHGEELNDDEEDDEDDEYDDEDDDEPYSDEEYDDGLPPGPPDFFQFGNSLTVKDGILTVADDLLKNDGRHFIDMMEQLAERRMQREEEIHYPAPPLAHQNMRQGHNHPPIDEDDDYDDDEDDEDYDSQEEDDYEGDEMDSMTEEQRMEEGRRMFQIFAARMFEQRVLTAYREKVAAERQRKLLEELEEESRLDGQREAKKAKEAAKKKEKKAKQKAAKEEEKAKRDAEKAAQEAAVKAEEERKVEEQRKRKEEQRKKREAEKKAAEEERQRKEAEKIRRAQEERERQAENERKQREAKERDRRKKEEARKKEREEREAKEKEAKDQKLKEEQERRAQQEHARKQKEEAQKAEREARKQDQAARPQPVALPPGLQPPLRTTQLQSPAFQVATPVVPTNIPTPARNRQPSQPSQQSHTSSPRSQKASTEASQTSASPAGTTQSHHPAFVMPIKSQGPPLHHPQPSAPRSPLNSIGRGHHPYQVNGLAGLGNPGPPSGSNMIPGMVPPMHMFQGPPMGNHQRFVPNGMNYPPGFGGPRPFQPAQSIPFHQQHPNHGSSAQPPAQATKPPVHSRQASVGEPNHQQAPISRPGPIARPPSTTPDKQRPHHKSPDVEVEQITTQLGSKALLDDSDEPIPSSIEPRTNLPPVGAPGTGRMQFASTFPDAKHGSFGMTSPGWNSFGSPVSGPGWAAPSSRPNPGWSQQPFGSIGGASTMPRSHAPRPIAVRLMLVQACQRLSAMSGSKTEGFHPVMTVLQQLEQFKTPGDPPVSMEEMLAICDTEGNVQNGGGTFEVLRDNNGSQLVKYNDNNTPGTLRSSAGDIGSPLSAQTPAQTFGGMGQGFGPPGGGRHF